MNPNDDDSYRLIQRMSSDDSAIDHHSRRNTTNTSAALTASERSSVVDSLVGASKTGTRLAMEYCTGCTKYMDQQVQYEVMQQTYHSATAAAATSSAAVSSHHTSITDMASQLFDEQSVVASVTSR